MQMTVSAPPIAIDCFAGAGGLSLGLDQAGFSVRAAFDYSEQFAATYRRNLGPHIIVNDAYSISGDDLLRVAGCSLGEVSLVAGGPPCQGFSMQRRGDQDDCRNELVFEFLRLVRDLQPELFLMENVSTLLGSRGKDPYRMVRGFES